MTEVSLLALRAARAASTSDCDRCGESAWRTTWSRRWGWRRSGRRSDGRASFTQRRSRLEVRGQIRACLGRFAFDDVVPQSAQLAEQFFLLRRGDVEFVQSLDQVFDQRVELARRAPHILVGLLHAKAGIFARAAGGEADEIFEIGEQAWSVALGELLVDARVVEHVPGEVVNHGRDRIFAAEAIEERSFRGWRRSRR